MSAAIRTLLALVVAAQVAPAIPARQRRTRTAPTATALPRYQKTRTLVLSQSQG